VGHTWTSSTPRSQQAMNDYERQREENIRKNNQLLAQLGLDTVKHALEAHRATLPTRRLAAAGQLTGVTLESTSALGTKHKGNPFVHQKPQTNSPRTSVMKRGIPRYPAPSFVDYLRQYRHLVLLSELLFRQPPNRGGILSMPEARSDSSQPGRTSHRISHQLKC
jgi:hypothetical protein